MGEDAFVFDTSGMQELLFEDMGDLSLRGSMFRCTLYTYRLVSGFREPCWVPVQPLAVPAAAVPMLCGKVLDFISNPANDIAKSLLADKLPFLH